MIYFLLVLLCESLAIESMASINILGSFNTTGWAFGVYVTNGIAYIGDSGSGLQIIQVDNHSDPKLIGNYNTPGEAYEIIVVNDTAYVADESSGLQIINVSNPSSPTLIGNYSVTQGYVLGVFILDNVAYLAADQKGLIILNITNPYIPSLIGYYDTPDLATSITMNDDIAYVADYTSGILLINVSNPINPSLISYYNTPGVAWDIIVKNDIAYVADGYYGLTIVNVKNSSNPTLIGSFDTPGQALGIALCNNMIYVADGEEGVQIIDVVDPLNPFLIGNYTIVGDIARGVAVNTDDIFYVAFKDSGLVIMKVEYSPFPDSSNKKNSSVALIFILLTVWFSSLTLLFVIVKSRLLWWYRLYYDKFYLFFPIFGIANFVSDVLFIFYTIFLVDEYLFYFIISLSIFILSVFFNYLRIGKWWFKKIQNCREKFTTDLIRIYLENNSLFYIVMYLSILINPNLLFIFRSGLVLSTFHFKLPINERDMSISNLCILHDLYSFLPQAVLFFFVSSNSDWPIIIWIIFILRLCNLLILLSRGALFIFLGDEIRAIPGYKMKHRIVFGMNSAESSIIELSMDSDSCIYLDSSIDMRNARRTDVSI